MDILGTAIALGASGSATVAAIKSPDLLKEIYGDLAKPGVTQVGKAIGSILGLGSTALIPFRIATEAGRAFEQWSFEQISKRFEEIPLENVVSISPEIGVPILERLSYTADETLRNMFIELLAGASNVETVSRAHPSFINIISSISPDEAIFS